MHEQVNFLPTDEPWPAGQPKINKMVFIGRNLNKPELEARFRACLVPKVQ